jgi:hypothetical protein
MAEPLPGVCPWCQRYWRASAEQVHHRTHAAARHELIERPVVARPELSVRDELTRSVGKPHLSDDWSDAAAACYLGAASFHGLEVEHTNVPDIYSYAIEAAEALGL